MKSIILALSLYLTTVIGACFYESIETSGLVAGDLFSNKAELEQLDVASLHSFTTCKNDNDEFVGVQFIILDSGGQEIELTPMGD